MCHTAFSVSLEAVQSNLTGPVLFSDRWGSTVSFLGLIQRTLLPRGQYNSLSKHFFTEAGCNLTL